MSLRIKVFMDGATIGGTRLFDADTGKELDLDHVTEVRCVWRKGTLPRVEVTFLGAPCEAVAACESPEVRASKYLAAIGRPDHPDAERDPVGALGQAAVDLKQALLFQKPAKRKSA